VKEISKAVLSKIKIKQVINQAKEVQGLYNENYRTLKK
jgi:hypothetical protein